MQNPCVGYVTSEHENHGGYKHHHGRDIGCPEKQPIYAAFDGILSNIVRWAVPGNRQDTWAPGRTGNGARVINDDGAVQCYNHVYLLKELKNGDKVAKGQLLGHVDGSGQTTGPHLHFETWSKNDPSTHFSPKVLYDRYKVKTSDPAPEVPVTYNLNTQNHQKPQKYRTKKTRKPRVPVYSHRGKNRQRIDLLNSRGHGVNVVEISGSWTKVRNAKGKAGYGWIATKNLNDFFEEDRNKSGEISVDQVFRTARSKVPVYDSRSSKNQIGTMHAKGYRVRVLKRSGTHGSWAQISWKGDTAWVEFAQLKIDTYKSSRRTLKQRQALHEIDSHRVVTVP